MCTNRMGGLEYHRLVPVSNYKLLCSTGVGYWAAVVKPRHIIGTLCIHVHKWAMRVCRLGLYHIQLHYTGQRLYWYAPANSRFCSSISASLLWMVATSISSTPTSRVRSTLLFLLLLTVAPERWGLALDYSDKRGTQQMLNPKLKGIYHYIEG